MAITFDNIKGQFRRAVGDYPSGSSAEFQDAELADFCKDGIDDYNKRAIQVYDTSGTGINMTISPTPTNDDLHLVLLYGSKALTEYKYKQSRNIAYIISDPSGRKDFKSIFDAFNSSLFDINQEIKGWEMVRNQRSYESDIEDHTNNLSKYLALSGSET